MSAEVSEWLNLVFRWIHIVAGVIWIGHLWFFNFVNAHLVPTLDADSKKKVIPELMPRALYWFRWGAAYTWLSGVLLLGIVYYMGGALVAPDSGVSVMVASNVGFGILIVGFVVYELVWKSPLGKQEPVASGLSFALAALAAFVLNLLLAPRAMYIHFGAMFGTIMAANVWMRIWPAQRRIITAIKAGEAPNPADAATAKLRSKHNTYMSVPLLFTMVSNHFPTVYGSSMSWLVLMVFVAVGWVWVHLLYKKAAAPAPKAY